MDSYEKRLAELARLREIEAATRELIAALPKCDRHGCGKPATRACGLRGGELCCEEHGDQSYICLLDKPAWKAPTYPLACAAPLRKLQALLVEDGGRK